MIREGGLWQPAFVLISALAIALGTAYVTSGHVLSSLAFVTVLITAVPVLQQRSFDLFSPWNYMFYYVVLNVLVRSVFVDFEITGNIADLDDIFYLGQPKQFLIDSTGILLVGFAFLTFGYLGTANTEVPLKYRIFRTNAYDRVRLKRVVSVMLLAAIVALVMFVRLTFKSVGDFAIEMLSSHRGLSQDLEEYRAYGYLRLLIGFANIVTYLAYARLKTSRTDRGFYRLVLIVSLLISLAMAFYSQSRAQMVFVFLNLMFIKYYLDGQRFPWKFFAIAGPVAIALFVITSSFRGGSGVDLNGKITPMTAVAPIVLNNGGIDASKTGHVIDYIDQTQDYQFGQTLVQFIWAVVPRQLWVDKPVNLDTYVGEKIYGADTYGASAVPPGFFAEMYMNYWYPGIALGALLLGAVMKRIRNVLVANKHNTNFVIFYVVVLQSIGMSMLASGVSSTIMGALMAGVPLVVALHFVTAKGATARDAQSLAMTSL